MYNDCIFRGETSQDVTSHVGGAKARDVESWLLGHIVLPKLHQRMWRHMRAESGGRGQSEGRWVVTSRTHRSPQVLIWLFCFVLQLTVKILHCYWILENAWNERDDFWLNRMLLYLDIRTSRDVAKCLIFCFCSIYIVSASRETLLIYLEL